jgi:hypothetical protein
MRVILAFQNHDSPCDDADFEYGEVEDYCVQITSTTPYCLITGDIGIDTSDREQVTISYTPQDSAENYIVLLRRWDQHLYDTIVVTDSVLIINGLDSCTRYFVKIAPDCGVVPYYFTDEVSFTTLCSTSSTDFLTGKSVVFPNPSGDYFYLRWQENHPVRAFYLRDVLGRRQPVFPRDQQGLYLFTWPEGFAAGLYWLEMVTENGVLKRAVVKN